MTRPLYLCSRCGKEVMREVYPSAQQLEIIGSLFNTTDMHFCSHGCLNRMIENVLFFFKYKLFGYIEN